MYALHERVLLVRVLTSEEPRVNEEARLDIHELPAGLTRLILQANSLKTWRAPARFELTTSAFGGNIPHHKVL